MGGIRACIQKHPRAFRKCFIAEELEALTAGSLITVNTCYRNFDNIFCNRYGSSLV